MFNVASVRSDWREEGGGSKNFIGSLVLVLVVVLYLGTLFFSFHRTQAWFFSLLSSIYFYTYSSHLLFKTRFHMHPIDHDYATCIGLPNKFSEDRRVNMISKVPRVF